MTAPEQSGQWVPQPRPDFVARTSPPMATKMKVATVEASASRRTEVMGTSMLSGAESSLRAVKTRLLALLTLALLGLAACGGSDAPEPDAGSTGSRFGGAFADAEA